MERFYHSASTSSGLSPPDTNPPPRPVHDADNSETAKRAVEALIYEKIQLEARLKQLEKAAAEASSKCEVHLKELREIRNDRQSHRLEMESLRTKVSELRVQLKKADGDAQRAKDLKSEISREYSILRRKHESTEQELKESEQRIEAAAEEVKKLKALRDSSSEEARKAREELNDCRSHLQAVTEEAKRLQKLNERLGNDLCTWKLQSQDAIKQLDSQAEDAMALKRAADKQRDDANEKAANLEKRLLTTENQLHDLEFRLKEFEKTDGRLRLQIDELKGNVRILQNENSELSQAWKEADKQRAGALENYARLERSQESVLAENRRLRMEVDDLKQAENKSKSMTSEFGAKLAAFNTEKEAMMAEIASLKKTNSDFKTKLTLSGRRVDQKEEECRINLRTKEMLAEELSKAKKDLEATQKDYESLQKIMTENERSLASDNRRLRGELDRTTEELHVTQEQCRETVERLTQELTEKLEELQHYMDNKENQVDSTFHDVDRIAVLENCIEELKKENSKLRECATVAAEKCETYKERASNAEEMNKKMGHREAEARLQVTHLEGELERLRHSFTDSSVSRRIGFEESVSLSTVHEEEEEVQYEESEAVFESDESETTEEISVGRFVKGLEEKKRQRDYVGVPLVRSDRLSSSTSQLEELQAPKISMTRTLKSKSSSTLGTMSHDIPHRFKWYIKWKHSTCGVCCEALPYFRYLYKCEECNMCVHKKCASQALNTCGLPSECEQFYINSSMASASSEGDKSAIVMHGWVRMTIDPAGPWNGYWATLTRNKLSFYDTEALALNDGTSRFRVSLKDNNWRIHAGTSSTLRNVEKGLAIEIHTREGHIYMLTPTAQAKQRWVKSLQGVADRQLYGGRKSSQYTVPVNITPFLTIPEPNNLWINATLIVKGYLLIAAQEGLYAVPERNSQTSDIVRIPGLCDVYYMEFIEELDRLLIVHGSSRELLLVDPVFLGHLRAGQTTRPQLEVVDGISNCHLLASNKNPRSRLVYAANTDKISIFIVQYGTLKILKDVRTQEPCICLLPTRNGFVFGADGFHIVTISDFNQVTRKPVRVDRCPFDCPVSALIISDNEILLAYYNFGVFVDLDGRRTREDLVEWSRAPLEFVYTEPFLYIAHYGSLQILEVLPRDCGMKSKAFKKEYEMYKCQKPHFVGMGHRENDVIFAIIGKDRSELHVFNLGTPVDCLKV
uniref:Phorbol-ester/DAG-type domain-containing protein n=1 Tax=Steinernema glaseri TaxID=37863 RepID=A0A1I7ZCM9_9BILA